MLINILKIKKRLILKNILNLQHSSKCLIKHLVKIKNENKERLELYFIMYTK